MTFDVNILLSIFPSQPRSLIANLLVGPPPLGSLHLGREGTLANHVSVGLSDGAPSLRSLSPLSGSLHLRSSYPSSRLHRPDHPSGSASRTMAGSGYVEHNARYLHSFQLASA